MRIHPDGRIELYGNRITFEGPTSYAGQVHYQPGAPELPQGIRPAAPLATRHIPPLDRNPTTPGQATTPILELEYRYHDGSPVVGAPFEAIFPDGRRLGGKLDAQGRASLRAPTDGRITLSLGEDARDWSPIQPAGPANPWHQAGFTPADAERLIQQVERDPALQRAAQDHDSGIGDWIWGVLQGDFNDHPTVSQTIAATLLTLIPGIDQLADVRDVIANLIRLSDEQGREDPGNWIALVLTLIGLIPTIGSALKGVLKILLKNPEAGLDVLLAILRRLGRGDPERFLRDLDWGRIQQEVRQRFDEATQRLLQAIDALRESHLVRWAGGEALIERLTEIRGQIEAIRQAAGQQLGSALDSLRQALDQALARGGNPRRAQGPTGQTIVVRTEELDLAVFTGRPRTDLPNPHAGQHNQDWQDIRVERFATEGGVDLRNLTPEQRQARKVMEKNGWEGDKNIESMLSSGADFTIRSARPGERLYSFGSSTYRPKDKYSSPYWLDEEAFLEVKARFYRNGHWDRQGVKDYLALPCKNRADALDMVEVTEEHALVRSRISGASERVTYYGADGRRVRIEHEMEGGGTQVFPDPNKLGEVRRIW